MKHTINDGLRMMGQLLLHHPTTGAYARDKEGQITHFNGPAACTFCFDGATAAVARKLKLNADNLNRAAAKTIGVEWISTVSVWDMAAPGKRDLYATTLAAVSAP